MREKLHACLLSPNLTAYVDELPENIIVCTRYTFEGYWQLWSPGFCKGEFDYIQHSTGSNRESDTHYCNWNPHQQPSDTPAIRYEGEGALWKARHWSDPLMRLRQLLASVENTQHISCPAKALAPPGHHNVTIEHWAHFAFLVSIAFVSVLLLIKTNTVSCLRNLY